MGKPIWLIAGVLITIAAACPTVQAEEKPPVKVDVLSGEGQLDVPRRFQTGPTAQWDHRTGIPGLDRRWQGR